MTNDNLRDCCQTPECAIHDDRCPIIVGPHARSHIAHTGDGNRNITSTVYCMCGSGFTADDERDARAAHTRHAVDRTNGQPDTLDMSPAAEVLADAISEELSLGGDPKSAAHHGLSQLADAGHDVYDATTPPGVTQLPAVTTSMTPAQFKEWLAADGTLFMVILPANRTFVIKVPTAHHEFFVAMMQQVRFALGPEVQAVRMNMVTGPPADVDAATGKADDAPQWAQPASDIDEDNLDDNGGAYKMPDGIPDGDRIEPDCGHPNHGNDDHDCQPFRPDPPEKHEYIARPAAEQEQPDGLTTRCPRGGTCPSDCSRTPGGCQNVERCAHGVRMGIGRYCADCDTSPVKYRSGAVPPNPIKPLPRGDGPAFA